MTNFLQTIGSNNNLDRVGRVHGLDAYVHINPGGNTVAPNTMAATVEALLGAIYLDSGHDIEAVNAVMNRLGLRAP